jgi:CRISPR-associated exonuclease Cas4
MVSVEPLQPVPLSALQHWRYCPRQCALIHVDGEWADNASTTAGNLAHERVDSGGFETADAALREYAMPVWSDQHGLIGRADLVEFAGGGIVRPVEFKRGPRRPRRADDIQLCAQALCLEEMFGTTIGSGEIWHHASRRRRVVQIDEALRNETLAAVTAVRTLLQSASLPAPVNDARCDDCSLASRCLPRVGMALGPDRLFEPHSIDCDA